jgi:ketosteroid isomerase-like protein
MKGPTVTLLCLGLLTGCQPSRRADDEVAGVRRALEGFFAAISSFDYRALRAAGTADYVLLEDGLVWNMDSLVSTVQDLQKDGLTIAYTLEDFRPSIAGPVAWATYRNRGILRGPKGADTLRWVESAIFRHQGGAWKLALLHSTRVRPAEP